MTISPTELYFLLKLDAIRILILVFAIAMAITGVIALMGLFVDDVNMKKRWPALFLSFAAAFFLAYVAIPSTKEMLAINIIPKVVNSEFVQHDVPEEAKEVYAALKQWLIEQATDVTGSEFDEEQVRTMKGYQLRKLIEETIRKEFKAQRNKDSNI